MQERFFVKEARATGVTDPEVLAALGRVPRRCFVPEGLNDLVNLDAPVPLPFGQTTTQPSLIALMVEALHLTPASTVLEVGTGYGYEAALMSLLAAQVWSIEWWPELAQTAALNLQRFGADNVTVIAGDGRVGLPEHSPYDGIIVAARADQVPTALMDQLAIGGRLVAPLGPSGSEQCTILTKDSNGVVTVVGTLGPVRFVPLLEP